MTISVIGIGDMGLQMAKNLLDAGHDVTGYDLNEVRRAAFEAAGGRSRQDADASLAQCDAVITCLPGSEAFVGYAEHTLLPVMVSGQTLIEAGTTVVYEMRRIASLFEEKGISVLDAPMSGGPAGVEAKRLNMFVGGRKEVFRRLRQVFVDMGGPDSIYYCGESGMGQVAKGVNQLYLGLINAACVEILSYALRKDLPAKLIHEMFDHRFPLLGPVLRQLEENGHPGVKFRELPYYIADAEYDGDSLPIAKAVYDFMKDGPRIVVDDHRDAPSYYHELMGRFRKE